MKNRILTLLILLNLGILPNLFSQNVSINSTGSLPDTSAMLDVSSTTKGFLTPRMTTVQRDAIILPATGLTIFNTTLVAYQVNVGTPAIPVWSTLGTTTDAWSTTGNSGTTAAANFIGTTDAENFRFRTYDDERMIIDTLGNVGIGTSAFDPYVPERFLVDAGTYPYNASYTALTPINGVGFSNGYLQIQVQNRAWGQYSSSDLVAASDGTRNGTVAYNTDVHYVDLGINSSGYNNNNSNILYHPYTSYLYAAAPGAFLIGNGYKGKPLMFFTNSGNTNANSTADGFERMRIAGNGSVGIGDFSTGTFDTTILVNVKGTVAPYASNGGGSGDLGTSGKRWGTVYAQNALNTSSDFRLKTHITNLNYGLKEVMAMQPVSYNWKTTPGTDKKLGLIAQDVRKIIPEVVAGDENKETLSMAYSDLIPVLINAIKEQQQQIDSLKKDIQLLKDKK
jgi:hypothetical protein